MAIDLEKLLVKVMAETSDAQSKLKKFSSEVEKTAKSSDKALGDIGKKNSGLQKVLDQIKTINNAVKTFGRNAKIDAGLLKPTRGYIELSKRIMDADMELQKFRDEMDALDKTAPDYGEKFNEYKTAIAEAEQVIEGMNDALVEAVKNGEAFESTRPPSFLRNMGAYAKEGASGILNAIPGMTKFRERMMAIGQSGKNAVRSVKEFGAGIVNDIKAPIGWLSRLKTGFGNVFAKIPLLGKLRSAFGGIGKTAASASGSFGGLVRKIAGIGIAALIARKVMGMVKDGLGNLASYSSSTQKNIDKLRSAVLTLKNAFGAAFAPLLNVVTPILVKFIGYLTKAANAVAHFFAALTGQDSVVVAVADDVSGIGDSAADANAEAKKLQRTLLGFDQINKLDDNSDSGSGSGSGNGGGFETVPVSGVVSNWADKFKEAWESGGDFYWLGESLADKFNDALANIPWEKIQANARTLANSLATFLNGFIENADWDLVGSTIANALNTAIYFAQTFVHTFNWAALGDAVASTINGFVRDADWAALGDTIGTAIYGLLTSINTFLRNTDWSAIGTAIVTTITNINWVNLFTGTAELIGNIATAVFDMLSGAISTAKDRLKGWIDSGKIWDDLFEMGKSVVELTVNLVKGTWGLMKEIVGAVYDVGISLFKSAWTTISNFLFGSGKDKGAEEVGISLGQNGWSTVKKWISDKMGGAVEVAVSLTSSFGSGVKKVSDWVKTQIGGQVNAPIGLKRNFAKGTKTVKAWIEKCYFGKGVYKNIGLKRSGWSTVAGWIKSFWGGNLNGTISISDGKAKGGLYSNGSWKPVTAAAGGGAFNTGQMFIAREAGPELVGTIGGHTAVMNNNQIVDSVSDGVYKAVLAAMGQNGGQTPVIVTLDGDAAKIFRVVQDESKKYVRTTGQSPFPV